MNGPQGPRRRAAVVPFRRVGGGGGRAIAAALAALLLAGAAPPPFSSSTSSSLGVHLADAACSASASSPTTASARRVSLSLNCDAPGEAAWFKLSEEADYDESGLGRVNVAVDAVSPDGTYADVDVTYPGGVPGGNGRPFHVQPAKRTHRVLAVRYTFEDENGATSGMPTYATDLWLRKAVFGTDGGYDGQPTANSVKAHIEQNAYGSVVIEGDTYPSEVRLPLAEFFDPLDAYPAPRRPTVRAILERVASDDPTFFASRAPFDFLIGFSPDRYNVEGSLEGLTWSYPLSGYVAHPSVRGFITSHMPVTSNNLLTQDIVDEPRACSTAFDAQANEEQTLVATKYDISGLGSIEVRLAGDTDHTGVNYYEPGGQVLGSRGNKYLRLGQVLPDGTDVIVTYRPSTTEG